MQGMIYRGILKALSVSAACELWYVKAPATAVVVVLNVWVAQDSDEASQQLPVRVFKTATDQSAKGQAGTVSKQMTGLPAFPGTLRQNILTAETFGAETTHWAAVPDNVLSGWSELPTPSEPLVLSPGEGAIVKLDAAPSGTLTISGHLTLEVIGG